MIDVELNNEINGRFSIEEVASDNEEEFVKNIPDKKLEKDFFAIIPSFKKSKPHLSKKKEFIYKEISTSFHSGFKCEVLNENTKIFHDFKKIWISMKDNYHVDESNLFELQFNVNKEKDFIKITDFFETHSDFKDNFFIHNEIIDKSPRQESTRKNKVTFEKCIEKNKECLIIDRVTALNSTLDSCLNIRKFCSIGTQTDATFEPEFKISNNTVIPQKNNKNIFRKKSKKLNKKNSKISEIKKYEDMSIKRFDSNANVVSDNKITIKSEDTEEFSPILQIKGDQEYLTNSKQPKKRIYETEFSLININDNNFSLSRTEMLEFSSKYKQEKVSTFTITNEKIRLCEKCTLKKEKILINMFK